MNRRNRKVMMTPAIGLVVALNRNLVEWGKPAYKTIQHCEIDSIRRNGFLLFLYARRQLLGKDYYKRACDLVEEIQCQGYYIAAMGGWSRKIACTIDLACEEILKHLTRIGKSGIPENDEAE